MKEDVSLKLRSAEQTSHATQHAPFLTGGFRIRVRRALYNPKDVAALVTLGEVLAASLENAVSRTA